MSTVPPQLPRPLTPHPRLEGAILSYKRCYLPESSHLRFSDRGTGAQRQKVTGLRSQGSLLGAGIFGIKFMREGWGRWAGLCLSKPWLWGWGAASRAFRAGRGIRAAAPILPETLGSLAHGLPRGGGGRGSTRLG